ncbi:hypothetical protein N656DRAFT_796394 [Canariomyces notabilis]|uniref:Protein kinase domain-containing protein n=1 Tax=Canariomyces notabilis TaxID=2074819 RepID=A0AAN6YUR1_9PEZI|nr:hypothetical protein N656DRAFT_796394 [Canariomyces arenarius]
MENTSSAHDQGDRVLPLGMEGFAYVFTSGTGEEYVYIRYLTQGAQSTVQLVLSTQTNEIVVQKVFKIAVDPPKATANQPATPMGDHADPDREVIIMRHLAALRKSPVNPEAEWLHPRWPELISSHDAPVSVVEKGEAKTILSRVSYWGLCNGGSLIDWVRAQADNNYTERPCFPVSIVARCIGQVCETLEFLYTAGEEPVYHFDLHLANIFIHFSSYTPDLPDFYLGDFGSARIASESLAHEAAKDRHRGGDDAIPGRRVWDTGIFMASLSEFVWRPMFHHHLHLNTERREDMLGLRDLMSKAAYLQSKENTAALTNPHSRPPSLLGVITAAKELEKKARDIELTSDKEAYDKAAAEEDAHKKKIGGPWTIVRTI